MIIEHMLLADDDARTFPNTLSIVETFTLPDLKPVKKEFLGKVKY